MARRVYRVCRARHARLDGEGARLVGGRWNSPSRAVVSMAKSAVLAVLENLVHMRREDFPTGYVRVAATIPANLRVISDSELRLRRALRDLSTVALGDSWADGNESAVLEVPSAVVPTEHVFVLNPFHPDFETIVVEPPALFHFDPRLFT